MHTGQVYHAVESPARTRGRTAPLHRRAGATRERRQATSHNPRTMRERRIVMKNCNALKNQTTRRILLIACSTALAAAFTVSLPQPAHAVHITPPPVPRPSRWKRGTSRSSRATPSAPRTTSACRARTRPRLRRQCPDASGFAWLLFTPEATLFNDHGKQVTTHFFSPNPAEDGTIRATWQHSQDTSIVWGARRSPTHPRFVAQGAIPWLTASDGWSPEGTDRGDTLTATTFIQRLNTAGGVAPSDGCSRSRTSARRRSCLTRPTTSSTRRTTD